MVKVEKFNRIKVRIDKDEAIFIYGDTLKCVALRNGEKEVNTFQDINEVNQFLEWATKEGYKVFID